MNDLLLNSRVLGAMKEHACLTEEEEIVLQDWAKGRCIASTAMMHNISERTVSNLRSRLRKKYDGIQAYLDLPPRNK